MAIGSALAIGLGAASLFGASKSASAAKSAAKSQARSADAATDLQREIYYNNLDLTEDQRRIGGAALEDYNRVAKDFDYGKIGQQFNLNSLNRDYDLDGIREGFRADPGYQFRIDEATKAAENNAAARGMRTSGAFAKALQRDVQGYASNEYNNYYNRALNENVLGYNRDLNENVLGYNRRMGQHTDRLNHLASLAGIGQTGTASAINAGNTFAAGAGANMINAGNAQAQGTIGASNAWNSGINSLASLYGAYQGGMFAPMGAA